MEFRLGDLLELFLAGYDDKVYIDLQYNDFDVIQEDVRIIDPKIQEYMDNKIYALQECCGRIVVLIERKEGNT